MKLRRTTLYQAVLAAFLILSCLSPAFSAQAATVVTWLLAAPMTEGRSYHTATLLPNGKVLVTGGYDSYTVKFTASAELYDPATGAWISAGTMSTARGYHSATLLADGRVLVAGGRPIDYYGNSLASADLYDPATNSWSAAAPMPQPHERQSAILLPTGKVLEVCYSYNTLLYDPASDSWSPAAEPPFGCTRAMSLPDGRVQVFRAIPTSTQTNAAVYDPYTNTSTQGDSLPAGRSNPVTALLPDGKVLVTGADYSNAGAFTAALYDPATSAWSPVAQMPVAAYYSFYTATTLSDGKVLVAGGHVFWEPVPEAQLYDPVSNTWSATWPLAYARYYHTATLLKDGNVLVSGGCHQGPTCDSVNSAEIYPIQVGAWHSAGTMNLNRTGAPAILLLNGKALVAGGYNPDQPDSTSAELYDPASNTWSPAASMPAARDNYMAARLLDGRVLVAGGSSGYDTVSSASLYNPATDSWSPAGQMTTPRIGARAVPLLDGKVLVIGGEDNASNKLASTELYNPATNTWSAAASLPASRSGFTATLLPNGKVLVAGGNHGLTDLASTLLYDPASNKWWAGPNMAAARSIHTATLLRDGRVLVAGGKVYSNFSETVLSSAEIYDPLSNSWSPAANMPLIRTAHAATLLMDGRVLLVGGYSAFYNAPDNIGPAVIYDPITNTWAITPVMLTARDGHTANLLTNGRVLVSGGCLGTCQTCADPEYFDLPVHFDHWTYAPLIVR